MDFRVAQGSSMGWLKDFRVAQGSAILNCGDLKGVKHQNLEQSNR